MLDGGRWKQIGGITQILMAHFPHHAKITTGPLTIALLVGAFDGHKEWVARLSANLSGHSIRHWVQHQLIHPKYMMFAPKWWMSSAL